MAFLKESDFPADNIIRYLEHEIGAYYRGSLAWLNIYNSNQEVEESYIVDRESLWNNSLAEVQSLTGDPTYLSEQMYKEIEQLNPSKEIFDRFILMNNDERMKFLKKILQKIFLLLILHRLKGDNYANLSRNCRNGSPQEYSRRCSRARNESR
ncbi:hypothetical protein OBG91_11590 [Lactococcus lactis]|nr:hypothetical protein [Lactococcus lactis]